MAYQRWHKPGRFYVWAGNDGLHIWPEGTHDGTGGIVVKNDVAGRDNAEAILRGCFEHLIDQGMSVKIRKGEIVVEKKS